MGPHVLFIPIFASLVAMLQVLQIQAALSQQGGSQVKSEGNDFNV